MPPAARLTDMHVCPMVTGLVPHVGGPIVGPGAPKVLICGLPAARVSDMLTCVGPPDTIIMGSPTVLIGGMMAARLGDPTAHGGRIVVGAPTVMIGETGMGGAGTSTGQGMGVAKSAAVGCVSQNPSILSKPNPPVALVAPPPSFYQHGGGSGGGGGSAHGDSPSGGTAQHTPEKKIVCGLKANSVKVTCQHGRPAKNGLLEVVPEEGGDNVQCISAIIATCGKHPIWEIGGELNSTRTGVNTTVKAAAYRILPEKLSKYPIWLGFIDPLVYSISVSSCSGPSYAFDLNAYPVDEQTDSFEAELFEKSFKPIREELEELLKQLVDHPKIEFLIGSGSYSLQWKEDPKSNLAFYGWAFKLGLTPLLSASFRAPIGPNAMIPAALRRFGNAGFFFEAKGEITIQMVGAQKGPKWIDPGYFNLESENTLQFAVGGSAYVGDEDDPVIKAEVAIHSGIDLDLDGKLEDHQPVVDAKAVWEGLTGTYTFHFLFLPDKNGECTFIEKKEIWSDTFHPFASPESGTEGGS